MNNYNDELYHHGILGQKWGVRRYQNQDGSLTAAGRKRYSKAVGGDQKKLSTVELASIGASREKLIRMDPYTRSKKIAKGKAAGLHEMNKRAAETLASRFDTEKEIANIEKLSAKHLRVYEMYKKQRDAAIHDLYHDRQKFRQIAKRYADEVEGADKITDPKEKEALYDFYINEDGFQDAAEDWYVENVAKIDASKVRKIAKEYNDAVQDYCDKIIDSSGDLNVRSAVLEVTGSLKGGGIVATAKLLDNKSDSTIQKWANSAVQAAVREYGAKNIYEIMRDYKPQ